MLLNCASPQKYFLRETMFFSIALLVRTVNSAVQHYRAQLRDGVCVVTSVGFVQGAHFEITFNPHAPGAAIACLATQAERDALMQRPSSACAAEINYSANVSAQRDIWRGSVRAGGTYYLMMLNCGDGHNDIDIEFSFKNRDSYLDSRDRLLSFIYQLFSTIYFIFAVVWILNGYFNSDFRIPLHTIFTFLPIIRSVSLFISRSIWQQKQHFDFASRWKSIATMLLEIWYYGMFFTGIGLACYGFCTYRNKFRRKDRVEVILCSILLSGGLVFLSRVSTFKEVIFGLFSLCFCFMWYIKNSFIYMIITSNLLKKMKENKVICAKIKLSRNFVSISLCLFVFTIIISCFVAGIELRESISVIILEIGLVLNSLVQMYFFLFRKTYSGDKIKYPKPIEIRRFALLKEPKTKPNLCCLYTMVN